MMSSAGVSRSSSTWMAAVSARRSRAPRSDGRSRSRSATRARPLASRSRRRTSACAFPRGALSASTRTATRTLTEAARLDVVIHDDRPRAAQAGQPGRRVAAQPPRQRRDPQRPRAQRVRHGIALRGRRIDEPRDGPAGPHALGRQHEPVALAGRGQVVVGRPGREVQQRRRDQRRLVHDLEDVLELHIGRRRVGRPVTTPTTRRGPNGTSTRTPRSGSRQSPGGRDR